MGGGWGGGNLENVVGKIIIRHTHIKMWFFSATITCAKGPSAADKTGEFLVEVIVCQSSQRFGSCPAGLFPPLSRFLPSFKAASTDFTPWPNPPHPLLFLLLRGAHRQHLFCLRWVCNCRLSTGSCVHRTQKFLKTNNGWKKLGLIRLFAHSVRNYKKYLDFLVVLIYLFLIPEPSI